MRRIIAPLFTILLSAVFLVGCDSNSPKGIANKWLNSFYHMEYKEAKKYSTEDTQKMLDMLESFGTMVADSQKQNAQKIKIEVKDVIEEGDNATVKYKISEDNMEKSIHLKKVNGKWLVDYSKQDKMDEEMENGEMTEPEAENAEEPATDSSQPQQ